MESSEIRSRFLKFFEKRGHKVIPSASLVPENDPSVLFNTAGMQPLVPYLLGQKHPMGTRIVNIQKCVRTGDLDDIGDNRHFSFFEMMGNWSLGDYFKEDAIKWSYEFLTSYDEGLGLDPNRLYITIFEGDENAPLDEESKNIWMSVGIPEGRIYTLPAEDNWWSPGDNGPCGPCSEMFYDMSGKTGDLNKEDFIKAVQDERVIEIWNDVFMEYEKKDGKVIGKLSQKNVDTGAGLERMTAVMQGKNTAYDTDLFKSVLEKIREVSKNKEDIKGQRIIADHIRTAIFMVSDGVLPSNSGAGYVLRRLIRRALYYSASIGMTDRNLTELLPSITSVYKKTEYDLDKNIENIHEVIHQEELKFVTTLSFGKKHFEKIVKEKKKISGEDAFFLFSSFGYPFELTVELAKENNITIVDIDTFYKKFKEHQEKSRTASAGMFKGGLANHNEKTIKLHTAHHLLLAALQKVVDPNIKQRGSNITEERLRIDFLCDHKLTDEEKKNVEDLVNQKISESLNVVRKEMPFIEAEKLGAEMEFGAKYPETVSVYFVEEEDGTPFSKEFCGGPHVGNTSELGHFKIQKEEAVAAGVRRIKAILE